jgi:hypothetical protein
VATQYSTGDDMNPQSGAKHVVSVRAVKKIFPLGTTEVWTLRGSDFDLS